MANTCKISVIIPCFNQGEFLPEAVTSVTAMNRKDFELIVVDDGSSDERTRCELAALDRQKVKLIRQENKGLATARNVGISASTGEYIFPLDADDRMRLDWVNCGIEILDSDDRVGIVYGDAQCFGTQTGRWNVGAFDSHRLLNGNFIHASALYRRSVWERNQGYDRAMPTQGFEDWDFWLGALEHGWKFAYIPEVLFEYRRSEQSMIVRAVSFEHQVRDYVARKHCGLYRQAWSELFSERQSVRRTFNHLCHLIAAKFK